MSDSQDTDSELELLSADLKSDSKDAAKQQKDGSVLQSKGVSKAVRQVIKLEFQLAEAKRLAELGVSDDKIGPLTKPKRIPSEKQLENLKKGHEVREQNRQKRKEDKQIQEEKEKKEMEELIIKKAIAAKKRQIQKKKILDEVVPDLEPEVPLQKQTAIPIATASAIAPKPKIIFY